MRVDDFTAEVVEDAGLNPRVRLILMLSSDAFADKLRIVCRSRPESALTATPELRHTVELSQLEPSPLSIIHDPREVRWSRPGEAGYEISDAEGTGRPDRSVVLTYYVEAGDILVGSRATWSPVVNAEGQPAEATVRIDLTHRDDDLLFRLLPSIHRDSDRGSGPDGPLQRFLKVYARTLNRQLRARLTELAGRHDASAVHPALLPHLASTVGAHDDRTRSEHVRRVDLRDAADLADARGTRRGLESTLRRLLPDGWSWRVHRADSHILRTTVVGRMHTEVYEAAIDLEKKTATTSRLVIAEDRLERPIEAVARVGKHLLWIQRDESGIELSSSIPQERVVPSPAEPATELDFPDALEFELSTALAAGRPVWACLVQTGEGSVILESGAAQQDARSLVRDLKFAARSINPDKTFRAIGYREVNGPCLKLQRDQREWTLPETQGRFNCRWLHLGLDDDGSARCLYSIDSGVFECVVPHDADGQFGPAQEELGLHSDARIAARGRRDGTDTIWLLSPDFTEATGLSARGIVDLTSPPLYQWRLDEANRENDRWTLSQQPRVSLSIPLHPADRINMAYQEDSDSLRLTWRTTCDPGGRLAVHARDIAGLAMLTTGTDKTRQPGHFIITLVPPDDPPDDTKQRALRDRVRSWLALDKPAHVSYDVGLDDPRDV